jgi:DNA-directed RNA polymerase alpha subunit
MPPPVDRRRRKRTPAGEPTFSGMSTWTAEERAAYEDNKKLNTPLTEVPGLTVRVINTLEDEGVLLVKDLLAKKADELLAVANFGEKTLVEVREALKLFGLKPTWRLPSKKKKPKKR